MKFQDKKSTCLKGAVLQFLGAVCAINLVMPMAAYAETQADGAPNPSGEPQRLEIQESSTSRSYLRPETPSNVCLVLAMDMSGSVDPHEWNLQTEGLARAFEHPVIHAILDSGKHVAVREIVYGGDQISEGENWHVLTSSADAPALSAYFRSMEYVDHTLHQGGTTVIQALEESLDMVQGCPVEDAKHVVDVQGDGFDDLYLAFPGNSYSPAQRRPQHDTNMAVLHARMLDENVEVNGLPIIDLEGLDTGLYDYYQDYVAPYGRVFTAYGFEDFERAIILKLSFELASLDTPGASYAQASFEAPEGITATYTSRRHRSPA